MSAVLPQAALSMEEDITGRADRSPAEDLLLPLPRNRKPRKSRGKGLRVTTGW